MCYQSWRLINLICVCVWLPWKCKKIQEKKKWFDNRNQIDCYQNIKIKLIIILKYMDRNIFLGNSFRGKFHFLTLPCCYFAQILLEQSIKEHPLNPQKFLTKNTHSSIQNTNPSSHIFIQNHFHTHISTTSNDINHTTNRVKLKLNLSWRTAKSMPKFYYFFFVVSLLYS